MPTVSHENLDNLSVILTIEVGPEDYLKKVNAKLKEIRQNAQIKGFRPGKTPEAFVKRKFGNSVLAEEISKILDENIGSYIKEANLHILGAPMEMSDSAPNLDINALSKYAFKFELGITPEFEVKGLSMDTKLPYYEISIDDEKVQTEIESFRKKYSGGFMDGVTDIIESDMLVIDLQELDENGNIKEGGVLKEDTYLSLKDANNSLKEDLLTATLGDHFDVNVYEMESGKSVEHVRKHILGITPTQHINDMFRLTIKEIKRVQKAELNQDFFNKLFPDQDITTVEEFEEKIREEFFRGYRSSSLNFFQDNVWIHLLENNELEMPVDFLKKWLTTTDKNVTPEYFEPNGGFETLIKSTRWTLIREKLAKQFDIEVTVDDLKDAIRGEILRYFNYQIPAYGEMIDGIIHKVLEDKNEVQNRYERLMSQKVLEEAANHIGKDIKTVSIAEFDTIVEEYQKKQELVETEA